MLRRPAANDGDRPRRFVDSGSNVDEVTRLRLGQRRRQFGNRRNPDGPHKTESLDRDSGRICRKQRGSAQK
jgi:hypothetical protein